MANSICDSTAKSASESSACENEGNPYASFVRLILNVENIVRIGIRKSDIRD